MFEISVAQAGTVNVATSNNGQAKAYKDNIRHVIKTYMLEAIKSNKTDTIVELERNGNQELATILRKI